MLLKLFSEIKQNIKASKKSIKDVLITIIPNVFSVAFGIITSILVARGLGPAGMGEYALILSICTIIPALSDLGINQSAIRFASKAVSKGDTESQNSVLRWAFRIRMLLLILITVFIFCFAPLLADKIWHVPALKNLLRISLLIGVFTTISAVPVVYFQSQKRFNMNAFVQTAQTIITASGIILIAVLNKWSIFNIILVSIISSFVAAFCFFNLVPKAIFFNWAEFKKPLKSFFKISLDKNIQEKFSSEIHSFTFFLVISSIISVIAAKADVWFMGVFLKPEQIGLYSVALRLTLPITIIISSFHTVLWPKASAIQSLNENKNALKRISKLTALAAFGFMLYSIFIPLLIPYLFGEGYKSSIIFAQLLCLRYCISIILDPIAIIGYNFGLAKFYSIMNFFQLIMLVSLNWILLPKFGILGSIIALYVHSIIGLAFSVSGLLFKIKKDKVILKENLV